MSEGPLDAERIKRAIVDLEGLLTSPLLLSPSALATLGVERGERVGSALSVVSEERVEAWRLVLSRPELRPSLIKALTRSLELFRGHRIGLYAERLICALFSALPDHQLLAHDLQVYGGASERQTLGALDLLIQSPRGVEHLELTVKFYLKLYNDAGWCAWLGPNERDTMAKKAHRLFAHQLPLSERAEAQERLSALGLPRPAYREALCLGHLFEPISGAIDLLNPLALAKSVWVRQRQWATVHQGAHWVTRRWVPRRYPDWLHRDRELLRLTPTLSAAQVAELPLERGRYLMLSELTEEGEEARRWMLVSDEWGVAHPP